MLLHKYYIIVQQGQTIHKSEAIEIYGNSQIDNQTKRKAYLKRVKQLKKWKEIHKQKQQYS